MFPGCFPNICGTIFVRSLLHVVSLCLRLWCLRDVWTFWYTYSGRTVAYFVCVHCVFRWEAYLWTIGQCGCHCWRPWKYLLVPPYILIQNKSVQYGYKNTVLDDSRRCSSSAKSLFLVGYKFLSFYIFV